MSLLLRALGSGIGKVGKALWGGIKGMFKSKTAPIVSGLTNWASNQVSDAGLNKWSTFGAHAADHFVNKAQNAVFDGVNRFANSDWVRRKAPIAVPGLQSAGAWLKNRLDDGYSAMGTGRDVDMRQAPIGLQNRYSAMDGVER